MRGRTEPEEAGRADDDAALLLAEDEVLPKGLAVVVGLLPDDGLPLAEGFPPVEGLALADGPLPEEGLAFADGELADGAEGLEAGGGVACATGAPPPDRL